jgi:polar amino acid transport system substrate-binding protein
MSGNGQAAKGTHEKRQHGALARCRGRKTGESWASFTSVLALLLSLSAQGAAAEESTKPPLRLCADPANLPFSSADPKTPGLYMEIGQAIGRAMGRSVTPVWSLTYFGKHALRTTLLAGKCDASIGLPRDPDFMGPKIIFSKSLMQVGYALVVPNSATVASLDDLRGRRVAVQFASTPQTLLAYRDDIQAMTVLEPEEAMASLAAGRADAAFIWGPIAGYVNKTAYNNAYRIIPVSGPGLEWPAAIGFARRQDALRQEVDRAIDTVVGVGEIERLKAKYGLSAGSPVKSGQNGPEPTVILAAAATESTGGPAPSPAATAEPAEPKPEATSQDTPDVAEGREVFNGTCAHCHGPNANAAERRVNLRLLQHRYHDTMDAVFMATVTNGRPDKGMPSWEGVFNNNQLTKILSFLHTVQAP